MRKHLSHWSAGFVAALGLLSVLFMLLVANVPKASAYIPPVGTAEVRRTYYSDGSKTEVIGGWRYTCDGEIEHWGGTSGHVTEQWLPCP
jgi:hypothetical protein